MIEFHHLLDGLFYYNSCVLCGGHMSIKNEGLFVQEHPAQNDVGFNLIFSLAYGDKLIVNPVTEQISIQNLSSDNLGLERTSSRYCFSEYFGVSLECSECNNFNYYLGFSVDLDKKKIFNVQLKTTDLFFKEGINHYRVVNDYADNKTFLILSEQILLETPLLRHAPQNIFNRLKKLIAFS